MRLVGCLWLLFLVFLFGCAAPIQTYLEPQRSAEKQPEWIGQVPVADEDYLYFRGIRTGAKHLEDGEHDAIQASVRQILEYLGQEGIVYYAKERDELETRIIDRVRLEAGGRVIGARLLELYFEKDLNPGVDGRYDVFALLRYPRKELQKERRRYEEQLNAFFVAAGRRYQQGMEYLYQGRPSAALKFFKEAGLFLEKIPESRYPQLLIDFGGKDIRGEVYQEIANAAQHKNAYGSSQTAVRQVIGEEADLTLIRGNNGLLNKGLALETLEMLPVHKSIEGIRISIELNDGHLINQAGELHHFEVGCVVSLIDEKTEETVYEKFQKSIGFGSTRDAAYADALKRCIVKSVQRMVLMIDE